MPACTRVRAIGHAGITGFKFGRLRRHAYIAAQCQIHASAYSRAVNRGDGGFWQQIKLVHHLVRRLRPAVAFQLAALLGICPFG